MAATVIVKLGQDENIYGIGSAIYILQTPGRDLDLYIACPLSVEWAECHGSLPNRPNHEYWLA